MRFNENNCHAQPKQDNRYLSGNVADYRIGLIKRIGLAPVEALEADNSVQKYSIDELKAIKARLVDDMLVLRVERGVFVPAPKLPPARPVTKMLIPGGWVKIEIGDDHILTLTPAENRALGELMAGAGQQYASIEMGHQNAILAAELAAKVRRLEK